MWTAIFSDVHGNLPALEQFVASTRSLADAYLCLGDVVNYGPWNDECLDLVFSLPGIVVLEGNHERLFLGTEPDDSLIPLVREFLYHSRTFFTRQDRIARLPRDHVLGRFFCIHTIDNRRIFPDTPLEIDRDYLIGHSHHLFQREIDGFLLLNCGSIGQDRQRIDRLNYVLYNTVTGEIRLCQEIYPAERLLQEMKVRGYSQRCLDYYRSKIVG